MNKCVWILLAGLCFVGINKVAAADYTTKTLQLVDDLNVLNLFKEQSPVSRQDHEDLIQALLLGAEPDVLKRQWAAYVFLLLPDAEKLLESVVLKLSGQAEQEAVEAKKAAGLAAKQWSCCRRARPASTVDKYRMVVRNSRLLKSILGRWHGSDKSDGAMVLCIAFLVDTCVCDKIDLFFAAQFKMLFDSHKKEAKKRRGASGS